MHTRDLRGVDPSIMKINDRAQSVNSATLFRKGGSPGHGREGLVNSFVSLNELGSEI